MFVCVQYVAIGDSVKSLFIYWTSESNIGIEDVIRRHNSSFYLQFNKREKINEKRLDFLDFLQKN